MLCKAHEPTQQVARDFDTALTRVNAEMVKESLNGPLRKRLTTRVASNRIERPSGGLLTAPLTLHCSVVMRHLIRLCLLASAAVLAPACSTYQSTVAVLDKTFEAPAQPVPKVDLTNAKWQKLSPLQPESNPLRAAVVERNDKIGATRIVLKVPPNFALPPYWLTAQGNYTVLKGTFVFQGNDADGRQTSTVQGPGAFAIVPANLIQQVSTKGTEEGLLYITVYGEWAPNFAQGAFAAPALRAGS